MNLDRSPERHLEPEELAELVERTRQRKSISGPRSPGSPLGSRPPGLGSNLHPHLAECPTCLERLQSMSAFDAQLENLKSPVPAPSGLDCPDANVWREIAVALMPSDQALDYLQHASRCDHCGPLLRVAISDMDGNLTKSEIKQIAALESARPEWQQRLASRITGTPVPPAELPWWKAWASAPRLAFAGLGLVAVIALGSWIAFKQAQPTTPNDLLATAYSEQRTFELRIAGADYAPVRVQRGSPGSFLSRPAALLKAEDLIAAQFDSHHSDPNWFQAKARADLLEGKYDSAVDALHHALQIAPKSPGLLIDLGTACFQRALMADRQEDFGAAYESLSQALAAQPDNSVALFNRAIVAEHQLLYHQALDDWDHYLRIDTGSEWATEARQRADALRAKLKEHDQSHAAPLLTPSQIAVQANDPNLRAQLDQRVEEYLHEAVVSWLPQAHPDNRGTPDLGARQALFFLADLTSQQHGDRWLTDLLAGSSSPNFPQAVAALAAAVRASDKSDYENSARQADVAFQSFQNSGNTAGALYARFEQAFSAQLLRRPDSCRTRAMSAFDQAEKSTYWWLQIQLHLEAGVCAGIMGDLGFDERMARESMNRAQQAGYGGVFLRAAAFVAEERFGAGDRNGGWKLMQIALAKYSAGQFPPTRGYNIYGSAAIFADSMGWPYTQLALWTEAFQGLDSSNDFLTLRAAGKAEAARAATAAGQPEVARREYADAARLYALSPQNDAIRAAKLYNQIRAAQLETHLGKFDDAIRRLTLMQEEVQRLSESFLVEMFYSALGEVELSQRHYPEAEQALRPALALAEQNLSSLRSEEQRIKWSKDSAPVYLGLAEAALTQGRNEESLEIFESYLGAAQRAGRSPVSSRIGLTDSSRISSQLPLRSGEVVLVYGLLPGGLAIWTYDNRGISAQWLPGKNERILQLSSQIDDSASDFQSDPTALRRDSQSLSGLLIAPIEQRLVPGRTIVIETDESLALVPFEALLDSSGHYLLERASIVHSLGMYSDERLRSDTSVSVDSSALVVASTVGSAVNGLAPLPGVAAEAESVAGHFHNSRVLVGRQVTLSEVEGRLSTATIFHFAGHSMSSFQQSGLLLDDRDPQTDRPRLLDADSIRRVKAPGLQLAVLSACSTANNSTGDPSGFSSITESLLRVGVPHVVASRWAVDSSQTHDFVEDFYRNLLSGSSVSEATRVTALKMMTNPQTAHPFYWSAFAAYGRP